VYENIKLFKSMDGAGLLGRFRKSLDAATDLGDLAAKLTADLAKGGKAELAMELLYSAEIDKMIVPTYIDQGLVWLAGQLKRKEDGISGKSPVEPEGADAEGAEAKVTA